MSPDNTEEALESAPERLLRPSPPPPTASSAEVRAFLVQFFLVLGCERTPESALEMARKINADGIALYEISEKTWADEFGIEGQIIHRTLQRSKYGYDGGYWPTLKVVGAFISLLGLLNGTYQLWTERDARSFTVPIISTCIVAGLIIFNSFCKTGYIINSTRFPEGLKVRFSIAQPGPWGSWTSTS
ncbi:MAG: hypothetical protein Q9175_005395 [Cornicularia normoerica]